MLGSSKARLQESAMESAMAGRFFACFAFFAFVSSSG